MDPVFQLVTQIEEFFVNNSKLFVAIGFPIGFYLITSFVKSMAFDGGIFSVGGDCAFTGLSLYLCAIMQLYSNGILDKGRFTGAISIAVLFVILAVISLWIGHQGNKLYKENPKMALKKYKAGSIILGMVTLVINSIYTCYYLFK